MGCGRNFAFPCLLKIKRAQLENENASSTLHHEVVEGGGEGDSDDDSVYFRR
ncbi:uncharacterized protein G2W53_025168 [Senna tora]|uniref:Uncharacterized protein n=1 Tax=Senna tora TaxID=362788 RepID=A0A834TCZ7_9FABA|nr:uncharacterized protein G2W53_025168 [Senna tora]